MDIGKTASKIRLPEREIAPTKWRGLDGKIELHGEALYKMLDGSKCHVGYYNTRPGLTKGYVSVLTMPFFKRFD